jgi:DNA-binding transcriptional regulator GbsR (MarR family)
MEEKHVGLLYPKKFFGCMMAVFIEPKPVTQDRIVELTGYSRTTISQMLRLIQVNFPLKVSKKPSVRKKYYSIDLPPQEFMLTFLRMILTTYQDRTDFLLPLIVELQPYAAKHSRFQKFKEFLENLYTMSRIYIQLLVDTEEDFAKMIKNLPVTPTSPLTSRTPISPTDHPYIQQLLKPPDIPTIVDHQPFTDDKMAQAYTHLKNKYYQKFRENLTSTESQSAIARLVIGTELLLEQRPLTQEQIQEAVHFQRSTISDTLKLLLNWNMVQVIKHPGNPKKHYMIIQSWESRTINRLRVNRAYAVEVTTKIATLIHQLEQQSTPLANKSLIEFFQHIQHSYSQFELYFKLVEEKYLNIRLKEYLGQRTPTKIT